MFEAYLTVFQSKEPLIHCVFGEMKNVLLSLQRHFIKPINFEGKTAKELIKDLCCWQGESPRNEKYRLWHKC